MLFWLRKKVASVDKQLEFIAGMIKKEYSKDQKIRNKGGDQGGMCDKQVRRQALKCEVTPTDFDRKGPSPSCSLGTYPGGHETHVTGFSDLGINICPLWAGPFFIFLNV